MTWTQRRTFFSREQFQFNTLSQEECGVTMTLCWDHVAQTTIVAKEAGFAQKKMIHHCLWVRCKLLQYGPRRRVRDNGSTYYNDMVLGVEPTSTLQPRWFDIDCCQAKLWSCVWAPCRKWRFIPNSKVSNHRSSSVFVRAPTQKQKRPTSAERRKKYFTEDGTWIMKCPTP